MAEKRRTRVGEVQNDEPPPEQKICHNEIHLSRLGSIRYTVRYMGGLFLGCWQLPPSLMASMPRSDYCLCRLSDVGLVS